MKYSATVVAWFSAFSNENASVSATNALRWHVAEADQIGERRTLADRRTLSERRTPSDGRRPSDRRMLFDRRSIAPLAVMERTPPERCETCGGALVAPDTFGLRITEHARPDYVCIECQRPYHRLP